MKTMTCRVLLEPGRRTRGTLIQRRRHSNSQPRWLEGPRKWGFLWPETHFEHVFYKSTRKISTNEFCYTRHQTYLWSFRTIRSSSTRGSHLLLSKKSTIHRGWCMVRTRGTSCTPWVRTKTGVPRRSDSHPLRLLFTCVVVHCLF